MYLDGRKKETIKDLTDLIQEELNVKTVEFIEDLTKYMNFTVKPNFKEVGKVFGSKMKSFQTALEELSEKEIIALEQDEPITITLDGEEIEVNVAMVDIRVEAKSGFNVAMEGKNFIILNTERTEELVLEGLAREFVSKVQNLRKTKGLEITDRITLYYQGTPAFENALEMFKEYIQEETLATEIVKKEDITETFDINGESVKIDLEKCGK